jgi:hypothetical protein
VAERKRPTLFEITRYVSLFIKAGVRRLKERTQPVDFLPESLALMNLLVGFDRFVLAHSHG